MTELQTFDAFDNRVAGALAQVSGVADPQAWLIEAVGGGRSTSGARVNVSTVLGLPKVWSSVSLISGHVAEMPIDIKRRTSETTVESTPTHPVYKLLNRTPNEYQTPFTFWETLMLHALLQGNGRAFIERDGVGRPVRLIPLYPWNTYTAVVEGEKYHVTHINPHYPQPITSGRDEYETGDTATGVNVFAHDRDVFHIPGLSYNGFFGLHLTQVAKDTFGNAISSQQTIGYGFRNGGRPGLLIEQGPNQLRDPKKRAEFLAEFNANVEGTSNTGKAALLLENMKLHVLQQNAADAQLAELAEYSDQQIAQLFCLPTDEGSVYKLVTERTTAYLNNCLRRWLSKIEQEGWTKLLSQRERDAESHFLQFEVGELLRGDPNSLADYTAKLRSQNAINGNEVRRIHGFNTGSDPMLESYGNPNITTESEATIDVDDEEQEPTDDAEVTARLNRAIAHSFAPIITWEAKRICDAVASPGDFRGWVERFIPELLAKLRPVAEDLGVRRDVVDRHAHSTRDYLLTHYDPGAVALLRERVKTWPTTRIEEFLNDV